MLDLYTMGERIRQAREDMGYTRETFSEMANITPRFCYDIESGKKGVSIDTLKNICEALNLSADHLLDLKPLDTDAYDYTIFHVLILGNRTPFLLKGRYAFSIWWNSLKSLVQPTPIVGFQPYALHQVIQNLASIHTQRGS